MNETLKNTHKDVPAEVPVKDKPQEDRYDESCAQLDQPLPGYHFIRELGHGTQGKVFLARREIDNTEVAIKRLNVGSVKTWKEYELFQREAATLASLDVPGIAKFYEAIDRLEDNPPCSYIIQEYISGHSLNEMIKSGHRFSLDIIYDIIIQLLQILKQLHEHEPPVIHRDIKPSNILLEPKGDDEYNVRLIDFGAVANPQVQGGGSTVAGTFGYMPPEQLMGKPEPASDIYSLAAMAVQLISGKSPADMPVKDFHLIFEPYMEHMPTEVVATLRSMLAPKTENRLCDIDGLIKIFKNYKQNIFGITNTANNTNIQSISDDEYNAMLLGYQTIGSEGNIALWQRLSDKVPRKVPVPYRFIKKNFLQEESANSKDSESEIDIGLSLFIFIIIEFFIIIFCRDLGMEAILFLSVLAFLFSFFIKKNRSNNDKDQDNTDHKAADLVESKLFNNILKEGKKAVAIIQSITYLPAKQGQINYISKSPSKNICHYRYTGIPTFKITYKFNPPDDDDEHSITRDFYFHTEPDPNLRVGDPLPILYYLYRNPSIKRTLVISMPYPIPYYANCDFKEISNGTLSKANRMISL